MPPSAPIRAPVAVARRLLSSPLVDLLCGPHGIDRYLELIRPDLTLHDARAEVLSVRRQTDRSVTLTLRPNAAWAGLRAGQFVAVGVEIDGVRQTRTYSPAGSEHGSGAALELTVTAHPQGLVSRHLQREVRPGAILHLGTAQGAFALPDPRPERLVLISGGSGVTPVMSMLRTLCDEDHDGQIAFVHYARTAADWLYERETWALAARHPNVKVCYRATRGSSGPQRRGNGGRESGGRANEGRANGGRANGGRANGGGANGGGGRLSAATLRALIGDLNGVHVAVCGPPSLIRSVRAIWAQVDGGAERVMAETFTPPRVRVGEAGAEGRIRFLRSRRSVPIGAGTLLEQTESAGLSPQFGCRMGICHTCTCRKAAGVVRNVLTGEVSAVPDEDIQLCVSVPAGNVALEI
jgi:ferredoxin-NADP reductase